MSKKQDKKILDYCKLCGQYKIMTEEHIPPKSAFNNSTVKIYSPEEVIKTLTDSNRKPWDFSGLKYKLKQGGNTFYTLCSKCNSYTGTNYVNYYQQIVKSFIYFLSTLDLTNAKFVTATTDEFQPLPFIKQVLTMFASFTNITQSDEIRNFLLNKDIYKIKFEKYRIYMSLFKEGIPRMKSWNVIGTIKHSYLVSEITSYPFIFVLLGNANKIPKEDCTHFGVEITDFINYSYEQKVKIELSLPLNPCNIDLPCDYRTKEEINKCINLNDTN